MSVTVYFNEEYADLTSQHSPPTSEMGSEWGISAYATYFRSFFSIILYLLHVSNVRPSSSKNIYIGN
jgi:hypothetical protein